MLWGVELEAAEEDKAELHLSVPPLQVETFC